MNMTKREIQNPWEDANYRIITSVVKEGETLTIKFANGDIAKIDIELLMHPGYVAKEGNIISFDSHEIIIAASPVDVEVPWDKVRNISDNEFCKYMANEAQAQARRIGERLKQIRESKKLKAFELAERANVSAQTISRIEQGHTDVSFTTLQGILSAMNSSLAELANHQEKARRQINPKSLRELLKRLSTIGIDRQLILNRIIPKKLQLTIRNFPDEIPDLLRNEIDSYIDAVFGLNRDDIWDNSLLTLSDIPASLAYFKAPSNVNASHIRAYSHYAYFIARTLVKASDDLGKVAYPQSAEDFRKKLLIDYGNISLEAILNYSWDMGIIVVPLNDPGIFHGACWNIGNRHIIVLKQNTNSHARWVFTLLHELYHVFVHLENPDTFVVEDIEVASFSNSESIEEREANAFANQVIFGTDAEELAQSCLRSAGWDLRNLKNAVAKISKETDIRSDYIANYLAFRLSSQNENWWGSATKLQITTPEPNRLASKLLGEHISPKKLSPVERDILDAAFSENLN